MNAPERALMPGGSVESRLMHLSKRFYRDVSTIAEGGEFAVRLDARPVRTPLGTLLRVPSPSLAAAIADEWRAQRKEIRPATMPLTGLAATALDKIGPHRRPIEAALQSYAASDLLCYWADAPADLCQRQQERWQPLLDWAEARWRARFVVTSGILPVDQPPDAVDALCQSMRGLDPFEFTALAAVTQATGSLILGAALLCNEIDASEACAIALLDENYQMERWGRDAEAVKRWQGIRNEVAAAARFLALARDRQREETG